MADSIEEYEDKLHNTLAKVVMIDLVDVMNQVSATATPTPEENTLLDAARRADVRGFAIRGSALYNFVNQPVAYPRNPGDIDLQMVAGKRFDAGKSMNFSRALVNYAAQQIGGTARDPDREAIKDMTPSCRVAYRLGIKNRMLVDVRFSSHQLQHVLDHADHYRLRGQDAEIIQRMIDEGTNYTVSLKVDVKGIMRKPDLPPVDFDGNEVVLENGKFHGVMVQHFLEQAVEKIHAMCNPSRDNPMDQIDLLNFTRLLGREDGRLTDDDIAKAKQHMFHMGSTWTVHHRAYSAAFGRYADAIHGLPRYTKGAPNEVEFALAGERMQHLKDANLIAETPDEDTLRLALSAAHDNATRLLNAPKRMIDKAARTDREID